MIKYTNILNLDTILKLYKFLLFKLIIIFSLLILGYSFQSRNASRASIEREVRKDRLDNFTDWEIYRGDKQGIQYSSLDQINADNVHLLEPAWKYNVKKLVPSGMQSNPIVIDGLIMYFIDPRMNVVALNAASGEELWLFDPAAYSGQFVSGSLRGLTYWEDVEGNNQRIFHYMRDLVYAVDANTGTTIESFGNNGVLDLKRESPNAC
jgi:quinoprotein glucose dehydrogenase